MIKPLTDYLEAHKIQYDIITMPNKQIVKFKGQAVVCFIGRNRVFGETYLPDSDGNNLERERRILNIIESGEYFYDYT